MGTAVLHPQDCLAPSQGHPNRRFPLASDYTSAAMARSVSACHGVSLDCGGSSSFATTGIRGVLPRKDSSAGLLPLPDHVPRTTHPSLHKSAANLASVRGRGPRRGSPPNFHKSSRFPVSTYESPTPMQRRSFSYHDLVSHGRRPPACEVRDAVNSAHRTHMAAASNSFPEDGFAHPPIAPMAKTCFFQLYDTALLKWSEQQKVFLLSEATHLDSHLGRQGAKQSINGAPRKSSTALARRHGGSKLLNRSASEKIQDQVKVSAAFTRCGNREVAKKLGTSPPNVSALVDYQSSRDNDKQEGLPACPALPMKREANASLVQGSLCARLEERNLKILPPHPRGIARLPQATWSQYVNWTERSGAVAGREDSRKVGCTHESSTSGVSDQDDAPERHANCLPGVFEDKSTTCDTMESNWHSEVDDVLRCPHPVLDTNSWLCMVDERWAGPSFFNSPPPSALPVPRFTSKSLRTILTSPEPMIDGECGSLLLGDGPVPEAKRVAFATKDLRRLLHLDHACCDA